MAYSLPELGYAYDALEPHFDARTMEIHHSKHHNGYVTKVNAALEGTGMEDKPICEVCSNLGSLPADKQTAVRNNGGGHFNHSLFWKVIAPGGSSAPEGELAEMINAAFGSYDSFKEQFSAAAGTRFGSGWAWLSLDGDKLVVESTPNQDNPMMDGRKPLLGLDV